MPIAFYRDAFRMIDRLKPAELQVIAFVSDERDADRRCVVRFSCGGAGQSRRQHRRAAAAARPQPDDPLGARHLRQDDRRHPSAAPARGVPFHVISVLSADSMAAPQEMFEFYVEEGIEQVCFNVEESEGDHVSQSFAEQRRRARVLPVLERVLAVVGGLARQDHLHPGDRARPAAGDPAKGCAVRQPAGRAFCDHQHGLGGQRLDLLARAARAEECANTAISCWGTSIAMRSSICRGGRISPGCCEDIEAGVAMCREQLRVFQRLRRGRAGQQARRERHLCQHRDDLLPPDQDAGNRSRARCARARADRACPAEHARERPCVEMPA